VRVVGFRDFSVLVALGLLVRGVCCAAEVRGVLDFAVVVAGVLPGRELRGR